MPDQGKKHVLIVDDMPNWLDLLAAILRGEYEVSTATSYASALEMLKAQDPPFHVLVVDIHLDDDDLRIKDGFRIVEEINNHQKCTNVIVLTGYPSTENARKALRQLRAFDYLSKYEDSTIFDDDSFLDKVREAVDDAEARRQPPPEKYTDFDLHVSSGGSVWARSEEGEAEAKISPEVPDVIEMGLKLIAVRAADAPVLKRVGQAFYNWLFPGPIHTHLHQTEAVARRENTRIRLRLQIEAKEIASLPLEFLYRKTGGYYLAVNPNTVLSRYLRLPMPPGSVRRCDGPLHMLVIIADPIDQARLHPPEWEAIILDALADPLANGQMTLKTVKRATRKEIRNALLQRNPDIIQFVGHGIYQDSKGYLALVDEKTNKTWLVDDDQFANLYLGHDDRLGLISLATCESAKTDDPPGFVGIAPKLVQRGVPAVVAMQYKVRITTAKVFLEAFYTAVAARKPIDWATQSARNAISLEFGLGSREFATPVLYMRAKDGNIF